ncbi:hypothetical protein CROQUDRAFT_650265 [Cronartium quercuum f. sp. fusiforme G11]|uniref:Uncharacterized protein n=1 Tax=Cronartium quercuum f. sp. fusiforme G11 TaxID=708437 RepID=A0A9P6NUJ3_9BASI|nr:hypothetical protein CROQUDRAFT_650265 [Cronartium quercuum f. sp. fusiforme G11]
MAYLSASHRPNSLHQSYAYSLPPPDGPLPPLPHLPKTGTGPAQFHNHQPSSSGRPYLSSNRKSSLLATSDIPSRPPLPSHLEKLKQDPQLGQRRVARSELDQPTDPAFAGARPRPRPTKSGQHVARPYSHYTVGSRPLSAFVDDSRFVTGVLESALPPSARAPPMPKPTRTMSIAQLDQRHRLALQRIQQPANASIAREAPSSVDPVSMPRTARPKSAQTTRRVPSASGSASVDGRQFKKSPESERVQEREESAKENPRPSRWRIFSLFRSRQPSSSSPKSKTIEKAPSGTGVPILMRNEEIIDSDSDSDVPLAQLRPQSLRPTASMNTVRSASTVSSRAHPGPMVTDQSPKPYARPNLYTRASIPASAANRMSMMSTEARPGQAEVPLLPSNRSQKFSHRSSAWLDY